MADQKLPLRSTVPPKVITLTLCWNFLKHVYYGKIEPLYK